MFARHLAGLALLAGLASGASAQQPEDREPRLRIQVDVTATVPDDEHWIELQSSHFLLAGTVSEGDLKKVAADLELVREIFAQSSPKARGVSSVPTTVIVFRGSPSYRWFRPADESESEQPKGYVQPGLDKHYIVLKHGGSIPREIYRDYLRLLVPEVMPPVPLWFREGIADYFSDLRVNRFIFGDKRWTQLGGGIDEYDHSLGKKLQLLPLADLFKANEESPEYADPEKRKLLLAESWGIVHYLTSRPGGLASMVRLFNLLGDGLTLENGLRLAFGTTLQAFEAGYTNHIRTSQQEHLWSGAIQLMTKSQAQVDKGECGAILLSPGIVLPRLRQCYWGDMADPDGVFRIPLSFDKIWADVSPLKARALSEAEAWFYRGDLMLHIDRLGDADAYLQRSVEQLPDSSKAHASLGLVQLRQKRYREADSTLKRALEIDPNNYLAHYYAAALTRLKGLQDPAPSYDDLEDIHEALRKVVALAPQFAEAADMLAETNFRRRTEAQESQKVLIEALRRYPGRNSSWIMLANVAAQGGDAASARWLLHRVLAAGAPDAVTRRTATLLLEGVAPGESRAMFAPAGASTQEAAIRISGASRRNTSPRDIKPAGEKLRGVLTHVDCRNGLTLTVKTRGKTVRLRASSPFNVEFIARDRDDRAVPSGPVVCGPTLEDGVDVAITYRPASTGSGDYLGEPLTVEIRVEE